MNKFIIRKSTTKDIEYLKSICATVFGDSKKFINDFFSEFSNAGYAIVGVLDNVPISMALVLDSISYKGQKGAYIYSVATLPEHRGKGFGEKIVTYSVESAKKSGCKFIAISPAEQSLYDWYDKISNFKATMFCNESSIGYLNQFKYNYKV